MIEVRAMAVKAVRMGRGRVSPARTSALLIIGLGEGGIMRRGRSRRARDTTQADGGEGGY